MDEDERTDPRFKVAEDFVPGLEGSFGGGVDERSFAGVRRWNLCGRHVPILLMVS